MNDLQKRDTATGGDAREPAGQQIRGSAMLLVGRLLSLGMNFAGQVLIVRFLSKVEYGSFAFALSVVSLGSTMALLGFDKTLSRFGPIYHERGDQGRLLGSIALMLTTLIGLGTAIVLVACGVLAAWGGGAAGNSDSASLLLLLIVLVPINAIDSFLLSLFAVFANPRYIFFRRYVLSPGLKLLTVTAVVFGHGSVEWLAVGYTASGILGVVICAVLLRRVILEEGLLRHARWSEMRLPTREIFGFSLPLMTSDLTFLLKGTLVILFLEFVLGSTSVAEYRAVFPLARLNEVVVATFGILFMPTAARFFAQRKHAAIDDLYWKTATWITALSFPVFAACFAFSEPLTVLVFGAEYATSAPVLVLLSLGFYANALFGFNVLTLKAYGRVRFLVLSDLAAMTFAIAANLLLIPRYGIWGAAVATCSTQFLQNVINHYGLARHTSVRPFPRYCLGTYLTVLLATAVLVEVQQLWHPPIAAALALVAGATVVVVGVSRKQLELTDAIPQLARFPLLARVLG